MEYVGSRWAIIGPRCRPFPIQLSLVSTRWKSLQLAGHVTGGTSRTVPKLSHVCSFQNAPAGGNTDAPHQPAMATSWYLSKLLNCLVPVRCLHHGCNIGFASRPFCCAATSADLHYSATTIISSIPLLPSAPPLAARQDHIREQHTRSPCWH